jgi:pimeloyl-ACP methyl ester carboxylesterase
MPSSEGEEVRFETADRLTLAGTYFKTTAPRRLGVVVFCHEYLGDRWSAQAYVGHLRALGFDLFTFDFRNHGQSDSQPGYQPLQWLTASELFDLRAALKYVRSRPDADPAGVGLFGVSRGGCAALCVGGKDPGVWGVATDGAFPTRGTMLAYILRWAEIYVGSRTIWRNMPLAAFQFVAWSARKRVQSKLKCRFPDVERATARLAPRPLFMVHGEKDSYIGPDIARTLFEMAGDPKELWVVPKAKHNRCREMAGVEYTDRIAMFFLANAPRVSKSSRPAASPRPHPVAAAEAAAAAIAAIAPAAAGSNVLSH